MGDNRTSAPASEYDAHIASVNPGYARFHEETLDVILSVNSRPGKWLDTGCGTGTLALLAAGRFPDAVFTLADPSEAMLKIASGKMPAARAKFIQAGTQALDLPDGSFDVITAILAHHYLDADTRRAATANCCRMLKRGGIYVTFEHIRPASGEGKRIVTDRWERYQLGQGRAPETVAKHLARFDSEYFPITVQQHVDLMGSLGFQTVELLFAGMMQAGFYGIKQ